jgi:hypothetical protein
MIISLAAIAISTYTTIKGIQATPLPSVVSTSIGLGQKFNWTVAEVVEVQGNLYVYCGHTVSSVYWDITNGTRPSVGTLHLAKWQNGWIELFYYVPNTLTLNVSLSPYELQIYSFSNDYLIATFLES